MSTFFSLFLANLHVTDNVFEKNCNFQTIINQPNSYIRIISQRKADWWIIRWKIWDVWESDHCFAQTKKQLFQDCHKFWKKWSQQFICMIGTFKIKNFQCRGNINAFNIPRLIGVQNDKFFNFNSSHTMGERERERNPQKFVKLNFWGWNSLNIEPKLLIVSSIWMASALYRYFFGFNTLKYSNLKIVFNISCPLI